MTPSGNSMRAIVLTGHGGFDRLGFEPAWPRPRPADSEVLVAVGACAINATDINTRVGWYAREGDESGAWDTPIAFPRVQGADVCGTVAEVGPGANQALVGRRVLVDPWIRDPEAPEDLYRCGYLGSERDGGYAEFVTVPARNVHPIESPLTDAELASFATSSGTALNMVRRSGLQSGDIALITGASGGVGSALVQLVRNAGAVPVAVAGPDKADRLMALGAGAVIDRDTQLPPAVRAATNRSTVDVIFDLVGGEGWPALIGLLRRGGSYVVAGAVAGAQVSLDLRTIYLADLTLRGVAVTPVGLFAELVGLIERGEMTPLVSATYPFDQVEAAQRAFLERRHTGKIVLAGWTI
jgi:NADPH:quinone reductase-like Zn-dependent oxidoreductase